MNRNLYIYPKWIDFNLFCVLFSLDLLAKYQRRNHFDALFIQSKASGKGKWSNVDYYFVARFTRGFSIGHQTIDHTVFDEVWLLLCQHNTKFHFHHFLHKIWILSYNEQWQHFELEMDPNLIEYPVATIRGPVPWKCNFQLANNRLDQVLMVTHPVLQAMNRLWYEL